jgi:DNA repair protein RecO (recombination protein O)
MSSKTRKQIKTRGIVLGSKTLGEADRLLFIFTREHGKIKAIAKGAAKPTSRFIGNTETLSLCSFEMYQSPRTTMVTDLKLEKSFSKSLYKDLDKTTSALLIASLADQILEETEPSLEIFNLLEETLNELIKPNNKSLLITTTFIVKFLNILGLFPDLKDVNIYHTPLTQKNKRLLNYLSLNPYSEILKIKLTEEENTEIKTLIKALIENETNTNIKLPL